MIEIEARYMKAFHTDETSPGLATQSLSLDPSQTALLLVDVYHGMQGEEDIEGVSGPEGERWYETVRRIKIGLDSARDCDLPVIYAVNQCPLNRARPFGIWRPLSA